MPEYINFEKYTKARRTRLDESFYGSTEGDRILTEAMEENIKADSKHPFTVFISHSHKDLDDGELTEVLDDFRKNYGMATYIDGWDPEMPSHTSGETADMLRNRIDKCSRFILLATGKSTSSNWCGWEVGYCDAHKVRGGVIPRMAVCLMCRPEIDSGFKGCEYLRTYPCIVECREGERVDGRTLHAGYYVDLHPEGHGLMRLQDWLR